MEINFDELSQPERDIILRIYNENKPRREAIASGRLSNPEKWFDYSAQQKALDAEVKSAYTNAILEYRAGQANTNTNSNKPSFAVYSDLLREGKDQEAKEYWYGDGDKSQNFLGDYVAALPGGEQGPAQGPNTPVRRDGDMFVPADFAPPRYRVTPQSKGPRGENLGEIAAEYGGGRASQAKEKPQWLKDIERQVPPGRGFTGPYDQFGNPTGVGGTVKQASEDQSTDYSIATALSGSDEQRQQQTYQAEFDPQKAQTATAAAKAYKKSASTEDPFRSQAVFG